MRNRIFPPERCPAPDDWHALLSGELPSTRIAELEAHLDGCPVCVAQLDALTPPLSDDVWDAARMAGTATPEWAKHCSGWPGVAAPPERADDGTLLFERKGRYSSHGPIQFGGMGEVYRAWEHGLDRWVAIKIPSRGRLSPNLITRFLKEAPRQAQLEHPNIVRVYASDEQDGVPYFSMELVKGQTLAQASRGTALAPRRAAQLLRQIASATEYAHEMGVFHRDLKPANIMLTSDGVPKIVDFGLARTLDEPVGQSWGRGAGTAEYMAPEQWEDEPEDSNARTDVYRRTDVYGLGAVLYELLTGRPPFLPGPSRRETRRRVLFDEPPRPRALQSKVPRDLDEICVRCLRKRPEARYATAKVVSDKLGRFLDGYPIDDGSWLTNARYFVGRHRRPVAVACAGLLVLFAVLGLLASTGWRHQRDLASIAFEQGQKRFREGKITDGLNQMRAAVRLLPVGESTLRGYFSRNLSSLESSLSREVDSRRFPDEVQAAAVSEDADGRYVLVGDAAGRTTLWDRDRNITTVLPTRAGRQRVSAVAINKSGTLCASGDFDGNVTVWDARSREIVWMTEIGDLVKCLAFVGNDQRLLTGVLGRSGPSLRMWEIWVEGKNEIQLETGSGQREPGWQFVASPTGDRFVSVPSNSTHRCRLWDAKTGRMVAEIPDDAEDGSSSRTPVRLQAAFSADGQKLAIAGARLTLYDARTGALQRRVDIGPGDRVQCLSLRKDGGATLVVSDEDTTVIRRMTPSLEVWDDVPMDHSAGLTEHARFTAQGRILTGLSTHTLRLLEPPLLALAHTKLGVRIGKVHVASSGDGSRIATLVRPVHTAPLLTEEERWNAMSSILQVWEGSTLRLINRIEQLPDRCIATSVAYGPTADSLALGCIEVNDHQAPVLIATVPPTGDLTFHRIGSHSSVVSTLAFSPDGRRLVTGSASYGELSGELKCWDPKRRSGPLWQVGYPTGINVVAVSSDGRVIAVGGDDGVLRLLPIDRPSGLSPGVTVEAPVVAMSFARAKPLLAVAQSMGRVSIFEVTGRKLVRRHEFDEPGAVVSDLAFSEDDETLYVMRAGGIERRDVQTMKSLDPAIDFADPPRTFTLASQPEAVVAVTRGGRLIERRDPKSGFYPLALDGPGHRPVSTHQP